jgi:predicted transcriptional regulator
MEIISKTNKNIFWIATSTNFAFEYLRKTIKLDDYFTYQIKFRAINNLQMADLIKKRNSISGYKLHYEINPNMPEGKELSRLADDEAQKLSEKEFFNSLNKKMQSNISLALLFWLRAIKEIEDRTLLIKPKLELNHAIFDSLSSEKTFILQMLVLHDGLKLEEIQKTVNFSLSKTNLLVQIMCDDGIINKEDDIFYVNPLLYIQTIELLKSKNFLN